MFLSLSIFNVCCFKSNWQYLYVLLPETSECSVSSSQTFPSRGTWSHCPQGRVESTLGLKGAAPESMQGMQCPLPARGQHHRAPGLLLGRGWTRRRSFMHVWFPLALSEPGLQGMCLCTWIPDLTVLRDKRAGNSKGQQTSVLPREGGCSESSRGVGASQEARNQQERKVFKIQC